MTDCNGVCLGASQPVDQVDGGFGGQGGLIDMRCGDREMDTEALQQLPAKLRSRGQNQTRRSGSGAWQRSREATLRRVLHRLEIARPKSQKNKHLRHLFF